MRVRALFLFISLLVGGLAAAQTADPARTGIVQPPPPDRDASVSERLDWIVANPEHVAVSDIFYGLLADAHSVEDLHTLRRRVLPALADMALRLEGIRALATVFRTARQLSVAAELYLQAYAVSGRTDMESLFAHAQILFELGDIRQADTEARAVLGQTENYSLKRRAYTLAARIVYDSGDGEEALEMLGTLASLADSGETARDLVEVETLLLMRLILLASGQPDTADETDDLLVRLFPGSVAAGIVNGDNRNLRLPGLPSALLLAQDSESGPAALMHSTPSDRATGTRRDQPKLSAVQVGSFSDTDNAEHLTADLLRLGLAARSEAISREGTTLHQVVVDIAGGSTEDATRILSTLHANGFDGFLVY